MSVQSAWVGEGGCFILEGDSPVVSKITRDCLSVEMIKNPFPREMSNQTNNSASSSNLMAVGWQQAALIDASDQGLQSSSCVLSSILQGF